jgi:hypothetical protein
MVTLGGKILFFSSGNNPRGRYEVENKQALAADEKPGDGKRAGRRGQCRLSGREKRLPRAKMLA